MTGIETIAEERRRQIEEEGYSDDVTCNPEGQLALAAACYVLPERARLYDGDGKPFLWPWHKRYYKPGDRIRELAKAGALIAAEIDRLQAARK